MLPKNHLAKLIYAFLSIALGVSGVVACIDILSVSAQALAGENNAPVLITPNTQQVPLESEACLAPVGLPVAECEALVDIYTSLNGPGWTYQSGWLLTDTPCGGMA